MRAWIEPSTPDRRSGRIAAEHRAARMRRSKSAFRRPGCDLASNSVVPVSSALPATPAAGAVPTKDRRISAHGNSPVYAGAIDRSFTLERSQSQRRSAEDDMLDAQIAYQQQVTPKEDRDQLIMSNLPQVYYIARRIHERLPQQVPFEDLVHAGVIGLIEAVGSYDPSKSVPLKSYTKFRVRGAILDSIRELDWGSRRLRHKGREIEEAVSRLSKQLGRQPDEPEIAAEIGISVEELYAL